MAKISIKDSEKVIEVDNQDEDILTILRKAEVFVKSSCGGHASCSDCIVKIISGEDLLTPPPFEEIQLLGNVFHITKERLACQTKVLGDVTLDLSGHDEKLTQQKLKNKNFGKPKAKVRKSIEVSSLYEERQKKRDEKKRLQSEKESSHIEHWKKNKDLDPSQVNKPKKLDGNKRPKPFKVPEKPDSREES